MEIFREYYINWLTTQKNNNSIKVLTGVRRVGKSTILEQFKQTLKNEHIIEFNFNDPNFSELTAVELYNIILEKSLHQRINYVLLDEVQEIKNFEKCIVGLFENKNIKFDIYITGSNSHMFSSELATLMTGRTSEIQVFPLTFEELNTSKFKVNLLSYLKYGGLGIICNLYENEAELKKWLKKVFSDSILRDIKTRHKIKNIESFNNIINYVFNHIGKQISASNLENYLKTNKETVVSKDTIIKYFDWLTQVFLLYKVKYYDVVGKKKLLLKNKYYATDLGLLSVNISYDLNFLRGMRLENLVLLQLLFLGYEVYTYENTVNKQEIDFICEKDDDFVYIQVCDNLNEENYLRESRSLLSVKNNFKKVIICNEISLPKNKDGITIILLSDWLLNKISL
ncbi:MAG: ATP-binding protein [Mycoplasmataceae bacterium]|nr:ATP-binding protein [Mycoplasmataceae bacterium]